MDNQEFQNLIYRYFRGQLSENEYELLTAYLQDDTFRENFEKAKQDYNQYPEMDEIGKMNWNRLQYKISRPASTIIKMPIVRKYWLQIASVAAILVLGLLSGGVLTYFFSGDKLKSEELVFETPRGQKSVVKLPDGSVVWLNAKSRLVYRTFSPKHRQVELKGEAFFQVAHNDKAPFIVKTNECEVEVLGTTFNVMAYDEFERKEITLICGAVNVHTKEAFQTLKPGKAMILKDHKTRIVDANTSQAVGWVENKFNFQNIPLSELLKRLENWYDVDIIYNNPTCKEVNFTGTFKNEETIWQVLDAIKVYTPIKYQKTELRKIKITVK